MRLKENYNRKRECKVRRKRGNEPGEEGDLMH
jgi:hypothetical protein